jgi:hypothetical protein
MVVLLLKDLATADGGVALQASMFQSSAALVRLSKRQAGALRALHRLSIRFFAKPALEKRPCHSDVQLPDVGPSLVRVGYHTPSEAKELIRVFKGARAPAALPAALRRSIAKAAQILDQVLLDALQSLLRSAGCMVSSRGLRRMIRGNAVTDIFHYHNRGCRDGSQNCTPHVDRGLVHAIVASPVDGLQLWTTDGWRHPHELWPEIVPHQDVVVLVNDALQALSTRWPRGPALVACTHRVVGPAAGAVARVSISHEVRPAANGEVEAWSPVGF